MAKSQTFGNLALASHDNIFNISGEQIVHIPIEKLFPPEFHPFQVNEDDEAMKRLVLSVKRYGVREPGLARRRTDGGYELLCGNRRRKACELLCCKGVKWTP